MIYRLVNTTDLQEKMAADAPIYISLKRMPCLLISNNRAVVKFPGNYLCFLMFFVTLYTAAYTLDCVNDIYGFMFGFECSLCVVIEVVDHN